MPPKYSSATLNIVNFPKSLLQSILKKDIDSYEPELIDIDNSSLYNIIGLLSIVAIITFTLQ